MFFYCWGVLGRVTALEGEGLLLLLGGGGVTGAICGRIVYAVDVTPINHILMLIPHHILWTPKFLSNLLSRIPPIPLLLTSRRLLIKHIILLLLLSP